MDEDKGNITDEISFEVVGGHTPFMQVFWIKEAMKRFFTEQIIFLNNLI
jgi:hypothetical protein